MYFSKSAILRPFFDNIIFRNSFNCFFFCSWFVTKRSSEHFIINTRKITFMNIFIKWLNRFWKLFFNSFKYMQNCLIFIFNFIFKIIILIFNFIDRHINTNLRIFKFVFIVFLSFFVIIIIFFFITYFF